MKNEDMVVLTFLEKVGKDCWKFQVEQNVSFESAFDALAKAHAFDARTWLGVVLHVYYTINDQGIWLLSHCFSNWSEMYALATKKSPWEENWQKRAEQGEQTNTYCMNCGSRLSSDYTICSECSGPVCVACEGYHSLRHRVAHQHFTFHYTDTPGGDGMFADFVDRLSKKKQFTYDFGGRADEEAASRARTDSAFYGQTRERTQAAPPFPPALQKAFSQLGIATTATVQEVKSAFRSKAKQAHPDTGGSAEQFRLLSNAYEVALSHVEKKK